LAIKYDKDNGWSNWFTKDVQVSDGVKSLFKSQAVGKIDTSMSDDGAKAVLKKFDIVDETEIQNLKKWREELSKTDNPLKTYKENVLKADKTTSSFGKKAGNVFKSVGAGLMSMGVNMLAGMAIDLLMKGIDAIWVTPEEALKKATEAAEKSKEQTEKVEAYTEKSTKLTGELSEILQDSDWGAESAQKAGDIYNQMADALEEVNGADNERVQELRKQAEQLKTNIALSKEQREEMTRVARANLFDDWSLTDEERYKYRKNIENAEGEMWAAVEKSDNTIPGVLAYKIPGFKQPKAHKKSDLPEDVKIVVEAVDNFTWGSGIFQFSSPNMTEWEAFWNTYNQVKDALVKLESNGYNSDNSEMVGYLRDFLEVYKDPIGKLQSADKAEESAELLDFAAEFLKDGKRDGTIGSTADENELRDHIQYRVDETNKSKEAWDKIQFRDAEWTDIKSKLQEAGIYTSEYYNEVEHASAATLSLAESQKYLIGKSKNVKTGLSAIVNVTKDLGENGFVGVDSMSDLYEAFSYVDNIEEYALALSKAKIGSDEYNDIISELTFAQFENAYGLENLNKENETLIANTLKEMGVLNAEAVAHDLVAKAIAKSYMETQNFSDVTHKLVDGGQDTVDALIEEAGAAGVTKNAYLELLAKEIAFGDNDLDVDDKIKAISSIAVALGLAGVEMDKFNGKFDSKESRRKYSEENGVTFREGIVFGDYYTLPGGETVRAASAKAFIDKVVAPMEMQNLIDDISDTTSQIDIDIDDTGDSSVSSKNDALDNYLKNAERRYKIHQDETKYISELEYALSNLIKTEEERLNVVDKIDEAYRNLADNRIKDLEHQIELTKNSKGENADVTSQLNEIQKIAHEEANRLRSKGYDDNSDEIQELQKTWWDAEDRKLDWRLQNSKDWIDERNRLGDWGVFGDNEVDAWERVVKWLNEEYPHAIDEIKEAEEKLFEARKDQLDKATDFGSSYLGSQKTLLQSYYDIINGIEEAQHEINKELKASKAMYEYLDEETRKLLFNQDDYNKLSAKLVGIQAEANWLQNQYMNDLQNATIENLEEITSQYEMQYETMMKQYEIAKAELDVAKKRQQLDNVLAERSVRMLIDGEWQWVAKTQDVIDAQNELADAEWAQKTAEAGLKQTKSMNSLTTQQDQLGTVMNEFKNGIIDLDTAVDKVVQMFGELPVAMENAISLIDKGHTVNKGKTSGYAELDGAKFYGVPDELLPANVIKHYATGSKSTQRGLATINEILPEGLITKNGALIPMANLVGGEMVFNHKMMENLWHQAQIPWNIPQVQLPDFSNRTPSALDQSIHIDKVEVHNPADFDGFVNELTIKAKSYNAITNKMKH